MPTPDRPVARADFRLVIAAGLLLVPLFFPRIRPPDGRLWEAGWDALHFPGFILITWTLARFLRTWAKTDRSAIAAAAVLALVIAAGSELSHDFLGRSSSWKDFIVDSLGVVFGVAGWFLMRRGGAAGRLIFTGAALAMLGVLLLPALQGMCAARELRRLFPDLGCFQHPASSRLWQCQGNASARVDPQAASLRVRIGPGQYGGVFCRPTAGDWSGRHSLRIEVENPGPPFPLGIRIDDARSSSSEHESRYNGERQVPAGRSEIRLALAEVAAAPAGRSLDLTRIRRLVLFTGKETAPREFIIDSAVLD